jgi:hypothetical protein
VVPLGPEYYRAWDIICHQSKEAWFWHTTGWLEYTLAYNPSLKSKSLSFLVYEDSEPVAAVPLVAEQLSHGQVVTHEFSFGGGWLPSPVCIDGLSAKQEMEVHRVIFDHIFQLGKQQRVGRISLRSNPFSHLKCGIQDLIPPSLHFGFTPYILPTQIIDVRRDPLEILRNMRKGHRSDIRRAEKRLAGLIVSKENPSPELFAAYRELHTKAAGRQTRPIETFEMMYDWIKDGHGVLFGATLDGRPVSFAYVNTFKDCAYYGSACNDPDVQKLPLAHFVQWQILNWLHHNDFYYYEIGWQFYSPTEILSATQKEVSISRFKRGFGGLSVPIVVSEKFLRSEDYVSVSRERMERFAQILPKATESSLSVVRGA